MENIKKFIGFGLSAFLVCLSFLCLKGALLIDETRLSISKINKLVTDNEPSVTSTINSSKEAASKLNNFITTERLQYLDEAVRAQIDGTNQATQGAAGVTLATITTMEQFVQPAISDFREEGKQTFAELRTEVKELQSLTKELTHQVQQNGDSANALLVEGKTLVADSKEQLLATLTEINKTANGLQVLTNDPELKDLIHNSNLTLANIEVTTKEIADLSTTVIEPIAHPKPAKGFNKYLFQPVLKVIRVINGAGNVFFLINKIGG